MDSVVQLVNRLQSAATLLGDNAASDKSLPSLWELLPSIVVIGGQVRHCRSLSPNEAEMYVFNILGRCNVCFTGSHWNIWGAAQFFLFS